MTIRSLSSVNEFLIDMMFSRFQNEGDGDGDKSDKTESESSKSMSTLHAPSTSTNGPIVNFIAPSITKRSVTLQMLLNAGILKPGEGTMSLEYHVRHLNI